MSRAVRLRAPAEDGAVVAQPPLAEAGRLLRENRARFSAAGAGVFGMSWEELRQAARAEALAAAQRSMLAAGEPVPQVDAGCPLLAAGHQPELFHPGVWAKNFALAGLARAHGAAALNLVVDNDTLKSCSLRLPLPPARPGDMTQTRVVDFDRWTQEVPYEERPVLDRALFQTFATRTEEVTSRWGFRPMLADFWRDVTAQGERTPLLGECFARARRAWERAWGCHNLEAPLSAVCQTGTFARFFCHTLSDLPRFRDAHNRCLAEYRRRYSVRSRSHPVPELAADGDWLEAPFWAWRSDRRRARLFARVRGDAAELRLAGELTPFLTLAPARDWRRGQSLWADAERAGVKIRTRALTTTLYARLFLCDLFLHGIGGGIYDELTDAVVARFYRLASPAFLVLSATLRLPLPTYGALPSDVRRLAREARDLHWNPQRHLSNGPPADPEARALAAEKSAWAAKVPADSAGRRQRFHKLREVTERLRPFVAARERMVERDLTRRTAELESDAVAWRRDYAFCLFPEGQLRSFCARFL